MSLGEQSKKASAALRNIFLRAAVAVALAAGTISYASGASPEMAVLKASISLLVIGAIGWVLMAIASAGAGQAAAASKGSNVDETIPEATPKVASESESAQAPLNSR